MKKTAVFLTCFGLFWSTFVLVFDGFMGYSVVNQWRSLSFSKATAVITSSQVTENSDSDGTTHGVEIHYTYWVDGRGYGGDRYRYGAGSSSDSGWARDAVAKYSEGSEVTVFYNPKDPSESLLAPGLDGSNYMWLLFLTPFNAVMVGFAGAGISFLKNKLFRSQNGGVKVIEDGRLTRIRLPRYPVFIAALSATGLIAFLAIFPIAFLLGGFHPKVWVVQTALALAYGAGVAIAFWQWQKARRGLFDLTIDKTNGTIELPVTFDRKERVCLSPGDVLDVMVETIASEGSEGGTSYTYAPTLTLRDRPSAKLAEYYDQPRAQQFADWLRSKVITSHVTPKHAAGIGSIHVDRPPDIS